MIQEFLNKINLKICLKLLSRLENHEQAISGYSKVIKSDPKNLEAYFNRGLDKILIGNKDDSCSDFLKAFDLEGDQDSLNALEKYCYKFV